MAKRPIWVPTQNKPRNDISFIETCIKTPNFYSVQCTYEHCVENQSGLDGIRFLIANRNNGTLEELVKLLDNKTLQWENVDVKKFIDGMKMVYQKDKILDMWKLANKLNLFGGNGDFKTETASETFNPVILEKHEMKEMTDLTNEQSQLIQYNKV